jgi:hypothetical protein
VHQDDRIVAVGLLTAGDLRRLGSGFTRVYPVDQTPCFGELLAAIDEADRAFRTGHLAGRG